MNRHGQRINIRAAAVRGPAVYGYIVRSEVLYRDPYVCAEVVAGDFLGRYFSEPWLIKTLMGNPVKIELYKNLAGQIGALLAGDTDPTANLANAAAVIYHGLPALNWAGFYLFRQGMLVLGPFQGKPACVRIPLAKGVCGTAAMRQQSVLVADVHEFAGHIACDEMSKSELVVPLIRDGTLIGVLDLDSPLPARFDAQDQAGCEALAAVIVRHLVPAPSA